MALPLTGPLSMTMIKNELGIALGTTTNLGGTLVRGLAGIPTGIIAYSDLLGKENFTFPNGDFEQGSLTISTQFGTIAQGADAGQGNTYIIPGWTIYRSRIRMNGLDNIEGFPTPNDSSIPSSSPGDNTPIDLSTSPRINDYWFRAQFSNDVNPNTSGTRSIELRNRGWTSGFGIVRGPYLVSDTTINLSTGDQVDLWWKATGGGDAYDVYAYLLNMDTGSTIELLNGTGGSASATTPWLNVSHTITSAQNGPYKFVFICGSFDFTGGGLLGSSLLIDDIIITKA